MRKHNTHVISGRTISIVKLVCFLAYFTCYVMHDKFEDVSFYTLVRRENVHISDRLHGMMLQNRTGQLVGLSSGFNKPARCD